MKKIVEINALFFLIVLALGCGLKKSKTAEGILPKEKMIPVMVDVQLAESAISVKQFYADTARQYAADYYNNICVRHQITQEELDKSLDYYIQHPKELDEIYTEVISELSEMEAKESK